MGIVKCYRCGKENEIENDEPITYSMCPDCFREFSHMILYDFFHNNDKEKDNAGV